MTTRPAPRQTTHRHPTATMLIVMAVTYPSLWLAFGTGGGLWVRLDPLGFALASVVLAAALAAPFIFIAGPLPGWLRVGLISTGIAWALGAIICEYLEIDPITRTSFTTGTGL